MNFKSSAIKLSSQELKVFLEEKYDQYNRTSFIQTDPISIPHQFTKKEDIEIAGFLTATIAWGQRVTIINNANRLMKMMGGNPHEFVLNHTAKDLKKLNSFVHRTFNGVDCVYFIQSLKNIYKNHGGLEKAFRSEAHCLSAQSAIANFRKLFFELPHPTRTLKHVSNPEMGSSAKRINMFLRWMVRDDKRGVDFGIWRHYPPQGVLRTNPQPQDGTGNNYIKKENLTPADLCCPLDVHTGNIARKLGLLKRKPNDWPAVEELMVHLRTFDPADPVKYDFALFGLGAFEGF